MMLKQDDRKTNIYESDLTFQSLQNECFRTHASFPSQTPSLNRETKSEESESSVLQVAADQ